MFTYMCSQACTYGDVRGECSGVSSVSLRVPSDDSGHQVYMAKRLYLLNCLASPFAFIMISSPYTYSL